MADVLALVDDLFFQAKIVETARHAGIVLKTCGTGDALLAEIAREQPKLIIVDLNARSGPLETIQKLGASGNQTPVIAYLSHVQTELAERAREAGCRGVMPRSKFSANLATILAGTKS
ncbi:MAG: response regulator [Candidatus Acidiferrales bacterium]